MPLSCYRPSQASDRAHPIGATCSTRALGYWLRSGGAWHLLPHDFPPWKTVYPTWRTWRLSGDWERVHAVPRERTRQRAGREPIPSAGISDRQSVVNR